MPEGDTIFRAATALRKALQGARVTQFRSAKLGRGPVGERSFWGNDRLQFVEVELRRQAVSEAQA